MKKFASNEYGRFMFLYNSIKKQKSFVGHLLRGSVGETALRILEGRMNSNVAQGRP